MARSICEVCSLETKCVASPEIENLKFSVLCWQDVMNFVCECSSDLKTQNHDNNSAPPNLNSRVSDRIQIFLPDARSPSRYSRAGGFASALHHQSIALVFLRVPDAKRQKRQKNRKDSKQARTQETFHSQTA